MSIFVDPVNFSGKLANTFYETVFSKSYLHKVWGAPVMEGFKSKVNFLVSRPQIVMEQYTKCRTFDNGNRIDIQERQEDLCSFQIAFEAGAEQIVGTFLELGLEKGINRQRITDPKYLRRAIYYYLQQTMLANINNSIINGSTTNAPSGSPSYLTQCDGLLQQFSNDPLVVDVPLLTSELLGTAAYDGILKVYEALPEEVTLDSTAGLGELQCMVDKATFDQYSRDIDRNRTQVVINGLQESSATDTFENRIQGHRIVAIAGLPKGTVIWTRRRNLVIFTDDSSDFSSISAVDQRTSTLECDDIRFLMRGRFKATYAYGEYVAYGKVN